jgi:Beta-ketoacyl synthase, N-terminal domain
VQVRFGGFMAGSAAFDAAAFGITSAEAELMDPQQRLLMEVGPPCSALRLPQSGTSDNVRICTARAPGDFAVLHCICLVDQQCTRCVPFTTEKGTTEKGRHGASHT